MAPQVAQVWGRSWFRPRTTSPCDSINWRNWCTRLPVTCAMSSSNNRDSVCPSSSSSSKSTTPVTGCTCRLSPMPQPTQGDPTCQTTSTTRLRHRQMGPMAATRTIPGTGAQRATPTRASMTLRRRTRSNSPSLTKRRPLTLVESL
jgi:hypothetical protein